MPFTTSSHRKQLSLAALATPDVTVRVMLGRPSSNAALVEPIENQAFSMTLLLIEIKFTLGETPFEME